MAISETQVPNMPYLETRASQLAAIVLTRQQDVLVEIEPASSMNGLDILASLLDNGHDIGRRLGILVQAIPPHTRWDATLQTGSDSGILPHFSSSDLPFPICQFVFTMEDDQGYWRWITQPDSHHQPLRLATDLRFYPLTNQAVAEILSAVRAWYRK